MSELGPDGKPDPDQICTICNRYFRSMKTFTRHRNAHLSNKTIIRKSQS